MKMEQKNIPYNDTFCSDGNKSFIKEENIENRQLPLINKKKLKPFSALQRSRFQKRLPNINSAVKRTQIPVVDVTSSCCEENELKEVDKSNKENARNFEKPSSENQAEDNLKTETTDAGTSVIESISDVPESNQSSVATRFDEAEPLLCSNVDDSKFQIVSRSVLKRNVPSKILHRTPFLKKPLPNVRNVNKNNSSALQEQASSIKNSKRSSNENHNEDVPIPKPFDVAKKNSVIDNSHASPESDETCILKQSDATEQPFPTTSENSNNELSIPSSLVKKNSGSKVVRRTPFVRKPVPNVRNAGKSSSSILQEEINKTTPAEKARRLSGCHDEEPSTPNTTVVPNSVKFPHITSILSSKKRNFKEKELPNKRRKYVKSDHPPQVNKIPIMDLIYYNPTGNPMQCSKTKSVNNKVFSPKASEEICVDSGAIETSEDTLRPVPKLVINENGDINIDESSLVVQRNVPDSALVETVIEETTYSSFRRKPAKQWGKNETAKFYKALSLVGTDFGLMEKLMTNRTRRELKLKFKREEKHHLDYINRAMYDSQTFDINILLEENVEDTESSEKNRVDGNCDKKKQNGKRGRNKKTIDSSNDKITAVSDESMDSSSQNSREQNEAFNTVFESNPNDMLESLPRQSPSKPIDSVEDTNSGMKMEVINSLQGNEVVEIEFAYSRRNRKPKRLAEGFIDTNDLEIDEKDEIYDCIAESMDCNSLLGEEMQPEENEILELQREIERSGNVRQASATVNSSEQSNLICCNIDLADTDVVNNVVADEVVPYKKRYTKKPRKPNVNINRMKSVHHTNAVARPSFTKYTPVEEFPSYKENNLKFSPERNLRTYTRGEELNIPKCQNFLVSSMQSPPARICDQSKQSTSLITSLNVSSNQTITIPVTPEVMAKDTSCNSVMIFAKAPDQENILHLFMYNKADTELNSANCKVENLVDCS